MNQRISIESLSKYRTQFMGVAIILVMICHNTISVPVELAKIRKIISTTCQSGVDMFMILSGLGCYYSFFKTPKSIAFWKKRITKIIIPYIIVIVAYAVIYVGYLGRVTLVKYIQMYSLITFFTRGALTVWFVAAILFLYMIFPLLYYILQKSQKTFIVMCCMIALLCITISFITLPKAIVVLNELLVSRTPAFLVGMLVGKSLKLNRPILIHKWVLIATFCFSALLIVWVLWSSPSNYLTIARLLFLPFVFSGMIIFGNQLDKKSMRGYVDKTFVFFGGITFELYLAHERVLATVNEFLYLFDECSPVLISVCANIVAIMLAIISAWMLQQIVMLITLKRLPKRSFLQKIN